MKMIFYGGRVYTGQLPLVEAFVIEDGRFTFAGSSVGALELAKADDEKIEIITDENGYIIADESTRTNIDGVFAAGDVRTKALRQVVTATADGAIAAHQAEEYLA